MELELKFMAKDELTGKWVTGYPLKDPDVKGRWYIMNNYSDGVIVDPKTIRQYIGAEDHYGRSIYQGDILVEPSKFNERYLLIEFDWRKRLWPRFGNYQKCAIIGNVFDNPDIVDFIKRKKV
ncbi:hypothetical protein HGH93_21740 [Chitinophaga polysaccharea]|uniref:YopX family protein n=1 Tax=Chitinophaga polysaccharea TaxID=1293035 RepID=UPI0014559DFD|nr:YopX family protein [Chitinophaga polysaccharea]NLR60748.1 hypothetical protein [Chitinophaga polysaccharea]